MKHGLKYPVDDADILLKKQLRAAHDNTLSQLAACDCLTNDEWTRHYGYFQVQYLEEEGNSAAVLLLLADIRAQ
jgi:hypothetical protein